MKALRLLLDVDFRPAELGHFMTWEKFVADCRDGYLMDHDGLGELAPNEQSVSNVNISPSEALHADYCRPSWATHVRWYNK